MDLRNLLNEESSTSKDLNLKILVQKISRSSLRSKENSQNDIVYHGDRPCHWRLLWKKKRLSRSFVKK